MSNDAKKVTFAKVLAETSDPIKAFKEAYPDSKAAPKSQSVAASKLANHPKVRAMVEEILQGCRSQFIMMAPEALEKLYDLAMNASSEKVKLEALRDILDRSGLKPPEQIQIEKSGTFGEASSEEIKDTIRNNILKAMTIMNDDKKAEEIVQ